MIGERRYSFISNIYFKTIVTSIALTYLFKLSTVSIFPLFIAVLAYYFYKINADCKIQNEAKWCGALLALFLTLGEPDLLLNIKRNMVKIFALLMGSGFFLSCLLQIFYDLYDKYLSDSTPLEQAYNKIAVVSLTAFGWLLVCWIPYWLACYPAVLTPDSISQIKQVLGLAPLVNHHPIAHTMTLKLMYEFISSCGVQDINAIIGFISFIQLLFLAVCFTLVVRFIYVKTGNRLLVCLILLYYGLVSFHGYYSVTIWKDITHGAITVLLLLALVKALSFSGHMNSKSAVLYVSLFLLCCAFCLFRSNGYYALLLWLPFLILFSYKFKKYYLVAVVFLAIIFSSYVKGPFYESLGVRDAKFSEKLSIPLQQIAYVVKNNRPLTEKQKYLLEQIIDVRRIPRLYKPYISDPIKGNCRNGEFFAANKWEYFQMWFDLGIKYPKDYLIAWLHQTRGYWYPNIKYWVYGKGVKKNDIGLERSPIAVNKVIEKISLEKIWGLGAFYNVAAYTWVLLVMLSFAVARRNWSVALCYLLLCSIFFSLLLGTPVFAEFRYYLNCTQENGHS
ncbi:MAG: DUF6020 family protein [Phascolarctobacterium sp.]|uniref:DUF6020 family protein n=1 Tax=Phascolarctobacterium sp. TaxID=2049039 RepID=UPI0026DCA020|nr:DUF6020 family protein [Phascolarctobacterium sp.]MDO4921472.1 DUF6020 family protein [Phascolarctobacterium sp.]